ncbi:hypothetical protein BH11BAC3_BH11BAC3_47220 [soil metagenome]
MKNIFNRAISFKVAIWTVILLSSVIIIFHFLILLQIIPFENVWGGKLKSIEEIYVYESISIVVNCLLILTILVKGQMINPNISPKFINTLLWIFVILFILNTLGNLTSKTSLETIIATPLTFIFALLCLRIVINTNEK